MTTIVKLTDILVSNKILDQVKKFSPEIDISAFELSDLPSGFGLNRMNNIMELTSEKFVELLKDEPVDLQFVPGRKHEIRNGRHRIARAILEGHETICVKFINI
jgi:hypothetical protein